MLVGSVASGVVTYAHCPVLCTLIKENALHGNEVVINIYIN